MIHELSEEKVEADSRLEGNKLLLAGEDQE